MSESDELLVDRHDRVLTVTFNRPAQHNAMTYAMYDGLVDACVRADTDDDIAVLVLRGAGGRSFVSGTDIAQFRDFGSGDEGGRDGIAYEQRITLAVNRLEEVGVPTVAAVEGYCLGGGLALATVCDLRVATRSSRFGVPIARTLGNTLSMNSHSLLVAQLGPARTLDLLLRARLLDAEDAHAAGFVADLCDDGDLDTALAAIIDTLGRHAPVTMWAAKQATARLRRATLPDGDDLVARAFGSDDFHRAVRRFGTGEAASWTGR